MGLAPTDGRLIRPIEEPHLARVQFDWEESVAQMLYLSPELRKGRTVIKQRELEEVSAKNQLLPEVNLSLLYRWVGVGDTLGPPDRRGVNIADGFAGSSALAELTGGDFQEGAVRLEVTPPAVGGRREKTRVRGAQLRLHQSRAYLQDAERLMVSQLSDAVAKTTTHYQLVQTHAMRWQAAEQEVEARLAEFKGGRSPVNVVLQSQLRRADAQISYYRALGEYNKSINYVDYLKGTMLANNNITLSEGPWNQKAYWDALERARERSAGKLKKYGVTRPSVVRQGPLMDAEHAAHAIGSGVEGIEGQWSQDGVILDESDMQLDMDMHGGVIDVGDVPLGSMGNNTGDMLQARGATAAPKSMESPGSLETPSTPAIPGQPGIPGQPAIPGQPMESIPAPIPQAEESIAPIHYRADLVPNHPRNAAPDNAPDPVRKRPIPTR
jgi:hypothetical protein